MKRDITFFGAMIVWHLGMTHQGQGLLENAFSLVVTFAAFMVIFSQRGPA